MPRARILEEDGRLVIEYELGAGAQVIRRKGSYDDLKEYSRQFVNDMQQFDPDARESLRFGALLKRVKKLGERIFEKLVSTAFPSGIRSASRRFEALFADPQVDPFLELVVDSDTRQIPWELAFGRVTEKSPRKDFLCCQYNVGRRLLYKDDLPEFYNSGAPLSDLAAVIGSNYPWLPPTERLKHAESEARYVGDLLSSKGYSKPSHLTGRVSFRRIQQGLRKAARQKRVHHAAIFHFTGHSEVKDRTPGLMLFRSSLTAEAFRTVFGKRRSGGAPYFTFLNACATARSRGRTMQIVDAFVDNGADLVVGTFWPVFDDYSSEFAQSFYELVCDVEPYSIGASLRHARIRLRSRKDVKVLLTWTGYVLYGDPRAKMPTYYRRTPTY